MLGITDEGKLCFGYLENYGYSTGYYDSSNTTSQTMPQLLTNIPRCGIVTIKKLFTLLQITTDTLHFI